MLPARHYQEMSQRFLQELCGLWEKRDAMLQQPAEHSLKDLHAVDDRIDACADGLFQMGMAAWPWLEEALHGQSAEGVFAAAFVALRFEETVVLDALWERFAIVDGESAVGFADALLLGARLQHQAKLVEVLVGAAPHPAAIAAHVLACLGHPATNQPALAALLIHEQPEVRHRVWQALAVASSFAIDSHFI